jgi:hypothetical protein
MRDRGGEILWKLGTIVIAVAILIAVMVGKYHCCRQTGLSHEECLFLTACTD